jgi:hypothetical protein
VEVIKVRGEREVRGGWEGGGGSGVVVSVKRRGRDLNRAVLKCRTIAPCVLSANSAQSISMAQEFVAGVKV